MNGSYESEFEFKAREGDALDKLRTETARYLRKYARRIKADGDRRVRAAMALDPGADPELVASEALDAATRGQFLPLPGPGKGLEAGATPPPATQ